MTTSSSISAHDLLIDHPFPGFQLVTPTDHDHHDHGHRGHYCHNWVSHHHNQLDQHKQQVIGSDGGLNQVMDAEKGIEASWACEQNDDLYDPRIRSADIDSDDIHDNWVLNSSKLKVVKKINPKRASTAINPAPFVEISTDHDFPYFLPAENDSSSNNSGNNGYNNNNGIRVCSDCNTTKTPLWRSGPSGPNSLCNACGIRQRKARRALAAAAAAGSSDNNALTKATISSPKSLKIKISNPKKKRTSTTIGHDDNTQGWHQPYKKRLKQADNYHQSPYTSAWREDSNPSCGKDADDHQSGASGEQTNNKRICFEEFITISLSKTAALHRVFLQDEKEAAILLMALSCGLVHN